MSKKLLTMAIFMVMTAIAMPIQAQFYTVSDHRGVMVEYLVTNNNEVEMVENPIDTINTGSALPEMSEDIDNEMSFIETPSKNTVRKKHLDYNKRYSDLPDLTLNNLLKEIRKNNIKYEKVVMAQAILETGWFTSSVCKNKNNLFGLTNPRTGDYYEFAHWTESVKAYYTKVQYKYKGGNYLLWLDQLPYATRTTYIASLIKLLNQYFM